MWNLHVLHTIDFVRLIIFVIKQSVSFNTSKTINRFYLMNADIKTNLFGLTLTQLKTLMVSQGLPAFTATQLADWIYKKQVFSFAEMTNLSKKARDIFKRIIASIGYNLRKCRHQLMALKSICILHQPISLSKLPIFPMPTGRRFVSPRR